MSDDARVPGGVAGPWIVYESGLDDVGEMLGKLDLGTMRPVIIVSGGAADLDPAIKPRLRHVLTRGVARAAAQVGALIVDGGTRVGIMELTGQAVASLGHQSPLLGVAPAALVDAGAGGASDRAPLDPNHSHVLLTTGESWGDELETMMAVAATVANGKGVAMVVAGGGPRTLAEVLHAVRRRWPIILLEGTGGITDQIAGATKTTPPQADDPALGEILRDGELSVVPLTHSPDELVARLRREAQADATLRSAWETFALLDFNADRHQRGFRRLQFAVLALGFVAALIAVAKSELGLPKTSAIDRTLFYVVLVIPIVVSVAIAMTNRFKPHDKWLLMRAAAEAIKREIFCCRARAGIYRHGGHESVLAHKVEDVTRRVVRTEVSAAALRPYSGPIPPSMYAAAGGDDGLALLTPQRYVELRLNDQLRYYRKTVLRFHRILVLGEAAILLLGGLGTLLAAIEYSVWVAVTTAAVTAITTFLGYRQIEASLRTYNQAATDLENVARWWNALDPSAQADPSNLDKLVEYGEKVVESELGGWMKRMQDALADLRAAQENPNKPTDVRRG
jgi:predicted Rossmann-fold nucleotide-binding protein